MPLLSEQLREKSPSAPVTVQVVLGLEWLLAVIFTLAVLVFIWVIFVWDVLGGRQVAFRTTGEEYTTEDVATLFFASVAASGLAFALVALLGKGIMQRSIKKCKIWLYTSSFILLALIVVYAYCLAQNYFENYYFLCAILYLGYKPFTLVAVYKFVRQLQREEDDSFPTRFA